MYRGMYALILCGKQYWIGFIPAFPVLIEFRLVLPFT